MSWERNPYVKGWDCIVCGLKTRDTVAPLGIASGSFPCHFEHPNKRVMDAYFKLMLQWAAEQDAKEELP